MKNILFKGRRFDNNQWIKGSLIVLNGANGYYFITEDTKYVNASVLPAKDLIYNNTYLVAPETVCQFTGLRDKNGNKIWENDIVRWDDDDECISVIRYDDEYAAFVIDEYGVNGYLMECLMEYGWGKIAGSFEKIETNGFDDYSNLDFEIIGNVFDSPELLER